jgi:hypothetical protein
MLRRFLFLTSAAAFLVLGLGAFEARAGFVPIPTTYDKFVTAAGTSNGNFTTVVGDETLTFSNFTYSPTAYGGATAPPASAVKILPFVLGNETGITFTAGWFAVGAGVLDVAISYTVSAPKGQLLTDAYLSIAGMTIGGGIASVGETLSNGYTLSASVPGSPIDSVTFAKPVQSITLVDKDIILVGNGGFATISIVNQGFSSTTAVPEPTSMALLGIGMAGFFTYRRLFKRAATV